MLRQTGQVLSAPVHVEFVCSGNICRSPTAEMVLIAQAREAGLSDLVRVTSSGTGGWHAGDDMDARSRATLEQAGYSPPRHVARQFSPDTFDAADVVVALDAGHRDELEWLAGRASEPDEARAKIVSLRSFDPDLADGEAPSVADPYYGGASGFTDVLAQVERGCAGLLERIRLAVETGGEL